MKMLKQPTIYVVEDDPVYQELVKTAIEQSEYDTGAVFNSGWELLRARGKMADIVILDYHIEGELNGLSVLKKIKSMYPNTQVVMMSSQEKLEVAVNCVKYGAYDYVVKNDMAMKRLCGLLKRVVRKQELLRDQRQLMLAKRLAYAGLGAAVIAALVVLFKTPMAL